MSTTGHFVRILLCLTLIRCRLVRSQSGGINNIRTASGGSREKLQLPSPEFVIDHIRQSKHNGRQLQTQWEEYYWAELPSHVQEEAAVLGYDQTKWDLGLTVFTEFYNWDELTPEQQQASEFFGWSQADWEGSEVTSWALLPTEVQTQATVLGYTANIWNNGLAAPTDSLIWVELTAQQQQAASYFGWTQETWDYDPSASAVDDTSVVPESSSATTPPTSPVESSEIDSTPALSPPTSSPAPPTTSPPLSNTRPDLPEIPSMYTDGSTSSDDYRDTISDLAVAYPSSGDHRDPEDPRDPKDPKDPEVTHEDPSGGGSADNSASQIQSSAVKRIPIALPLISLVHLFLYYVL